MSSTRVHRLRRRDDNEPDIITVLRQVGASVSKLDETGAPDLLVGWCGKTHLLEVKAPLGPDGGSSHAELTEFQEEWWSLWKGAKPCVVRSPTEALRAIGAIK